MSELFERIFGDELEEVRAEVKEKERIIESKDILIEEMIHENELLKKLLVKNGIDYSNLIKQD